ncbi:MAG: PKD domain-containing protein, partial [Candidatus Kapaibacterium sp.]
MRKIILICLGLIAFTSVSLHSQWIEKEGYWELSEKIPDLRDLKILPEENLIITVSKDNTIRHFEYDNGQLLKSFKPEEVPEDNDYINISDDGMTTIFAKYLNRGASDGSKDISMYIIDNFTNGNVFNTILTPGDLFPIFKEANYYEFTITIKLIDYVSKHKKLFLLVMHQRKKVEHQNKLHSSTIDKYFSWEIKDGELEPIPSNAFYSGSNIEELKNRINYKYFFESYVGFSYEDLNGGHYGGGDATQIVYLVNSDMDTFCLIFSNRSIYQWYRDVGSTSSGSILNIQQFLESDKCDSLYIRAENSLLLFDLKDWKIVDTINNSAFLYDVYLSTYNKYLHFMGKQYNDYFHHIFLLPSMRKIYTSPLPSAPNPNLAYPVIDNLGKAVYFSLADGSVIMMKPEVMQDISESGFTWSRDTIEVGEEVEFTALINISNCEYVWEFSDGEKVKTNETSLIHTFNTVGKISVKLTVTTQDNQVYTFQKDTLINVWEVLQADFDIEYLNDELPIKVQFNDKSSGTVQSRLWNFGDGTQSTELNPIHEYKYPGEFSSSLIASNNIDKDTIVKYDYIQILTEKSELKTPEILYKENTGEKELRNVFQTNEGFLLGHSYLVSTLLDMDKYREEYKRTFYIQNKVYNYDFDKLNTYDVQINRVVDIYYHDLWGDTEDEYYSGGFIERLLRDKLTYFAVGFDLQDRWTYYENSLLIRLNALTGDSIDTEISNFLYYSTLAYEIYDLEDRTFIWVLKSSPEGANIIKTDYKMNTIWDIGLNRRGTQGFICDTLKNILNVVNKMDSTNY